MNCKNCGNKMSDNSKFCAVCGAQVTPPDYTQQNAQSATQPQPTQNQYYYQPPVQINYIPNKMRPVAPTSIGQYIGWFLINCIPIIGFILSIVFAVDDSNMNRANYFRAILILKAAVIVLVLLLTLVFGNLFMRLFDELYYYF